MTTVTAGSAHHVAYHLFDVDQGKVSSLNPTVTVYPGQPVLLTGTSQVLDQYGTLLCSQKLENVVSALTPSVNAAGEPTALGATTFDNPAQGGYVQWGYNNNVNPATFSIWDPSITSYNLTMNGTACTQYIPGTQTVTFTLHVAPFSGLVFSGSQSVCPPVSYDPTTNTAGLIGPNHLYPSSKGCSIVYNVTNAPYSAQFGFLQTLSAGAVATVTSADQSSSLETLFEEGVTVDCITDGGGNYRSITSITSVEVGQSASLVFTSAPSVFTAPYYASSYDTGLTSPTQSGTYASYNMHSNTYLMMRVLGGENSAWVPVAKAVYSLDFLKATCNSTQACGVDGVTWEGEFYPYENTAWVVEGSVTPPAEDTSWTASAVSPTWTNITQESYQVIAGQGEFSGYLQNIDYWFLYPADAVSSLEESSEGSASVGADIL